MSGIDTKFGHQVVAQWHHDHEVEDMGEVHRRQEKEDDAFFGGHEGQRLSIERTIQSTRYKVRGTRYEVRSTNPIVRTLSLIHIYRVPNIADKKENPSGTDWKCGLLVILCHSATYNI